MDSSTNTTPDAPSTETTNSSPKTATTSPSDNKKLVMIIGAVIGALLLVLIILVIGLLSKGDNEKTESVSTEDSTSSRQSGDEGGQQAASREVLMTVPTSDDKLEYIIYKPQQNAANTTLHFAVRNICEGCADATATWTAVHGFSGKQNSYLIDDNNGRKYSTITDEDDKVLATPNCAGLIKYDEKKDCFVAFSKVPSGSTVSWVFGGVRIDNIKVE